MSKATKTARLNKAIILRDFDDIEGAPSYALRQSWGKIDTSLDYRNFVEISPTLPFESNFVYSSGLIKGEYKIMVSYLDQDNSDIGHYGYLDDIMGVAYTEDERDALLYKIALNVAKDYVKKFNLTLIDLTSRSKKSKLKIKVAK